MTLPLSIRPLVLLVAIVSATAFADGPRVGPVVAIRSTDGLAFEPQDVRIFEGGCQPDVLLVPRATPSRNGPDAGTLICYSVAPDSSGLVRATSVDQGRSWSAGDPVVINGRPKDLDGLRPGGPSAVQLDDGRIRLYFTATRPRNQRPAMPPKPGTPAPRPPGEIPPQRNGTEAQPGLTAPGKADPPSRVYSAISNDGRTFAFEDGVRFELAGISDPEVIRLPEPREGDARRLGPWLLFVTREGSTLLAVSRDGLTWTRDETFVWTSVHEAAGVQIAPDSRELRLYGCDRTGVVSCRFDPSTGDLHADPGARFPGGTFDPAITACGDGAQLLVCVRESTDKPERPRREPPGRPEPLDPTRPGLPPVIPVRPE
jgi:hypothetical protein